MSFKKRIEINLINNIQKYTKNFVPRIFFNWRMKDASLYLLSYHHLTYSSPLYKL